MWADGDGLVHALFHEGRLRPLVASVATEAARYHGLSAALPAAIPFERRIRDLYGYEAMFAADLRPVLDAGAWRVEAPLAPRTGPPPRGPAAPEWIESPDDDGRVHVETGPVGGPLPGFRIRATLRGTDIARLELAHGHTHRGVLARGRGLPVRDGARLAGRIASEGGVAHATAFCRAAETALGLAVPPRAVALRALAAECERAASHAAVFVRAAEAAGCGLLASAFAAVREDWHAASETAFGTRLPAATLVPGGVAADLASDGAVALRAAASRTEGALPDLARAYEGIGSLARRLGGCGRVTAADALRHVAGGVVARASGGTFDARRLLGEAAVTVPPTSEAGTADARYRLRLAGLGAASARVRTLLDALPPGPLAAEPGPPPGAGEGIGCAEAPEGDVWHVLTFEPDGTIGTWFARDPAIGHASLLALAARDAPAALLAPIAHSFGLRPEPVDL